MSESEAMLHEANRRAHRVAEAAKEYRAAHEGWQNGPIAWVAQSDLRRDRGAPDKGGHALSNQHTHPSKKPKRSTDAKAGGKGRGTRASALRRAEKSRQKWLERNGA